MKAWTYYRWPSVLACLCAAPLAAEGQISWTQQVVSGPAGRGDLAMAYDSDRHVTVLFGGTTDGFNGTNDTWEWDGAAWVQRTSNPPPARLLDALSYDSSRHFVVLFGGINQNTIYGDTWEREGTVWIQRPVSGPSPRWAHTMCFDSARGVTVLFGGYTGPAGGHNGETWEWSGTSGGWTQRAIGGPNPPPRFGSAMSYDSARHVAVLFGGSNSSSPNLSDTWEWDGTAWTQRNPPTSPSARYFHTMTYHAGWGLTILFGGTNSSGMPTNETWGYDGTSWNHLNIAAAPSPREAPAMVYDAAHLQCVLFGGYAAGWNGETWLLDSRPLCDYVDFNCDGDVGTDADIEAFFACLAGTCPEPPCLNSADFNHDGDVGTDADIEAFFRVLAGGPC
jgi:Galactose oxidase, central domain